MNKDKNKNKVWRWLGPVVVAVIIGCAAAMPHVFTWARDYVLRH